MGAVGRKGRGRSGGGKGSRGQGLFKPPRYKYLARIVKMDTVENARKAARKLLSIFRSAKTRAKKVRVKKATVLAANRAKVMAGRKDLSPQERHEFSVIAKIYRAAYKEMRLPPKK